MNSLRDTPERIEQHFGEAVLARDDAIKRLGRKEGIGPPDLCWVRKYATNTLGFRTGEPQGFYHWVQGLEMSSAASVAAYFAQLTKLQENPSLLQVRDFIYSLLCCCICIMRSPGPFDFPSGVERENFAQKFRNDLDNYSLQNFPTNVGPDHDARVAYGWCHLLLLRRLPPHRSALQVHVPGDRRSAGNDHMIKCTCMHASFFVLHINV